MIKTLRAGALALAALCLAPAAALAACPTAPTYTSLSGKDATPSTQNLQTVTVGSAQLATPVIHGNDGTATPKALALDTSCNLLVVLQPGVNSIGSVGASKKLVSSTLARIGNTVTYGGTFASPTAICLFTSVTACAPMTMTVSSTNTVNGYLTSLRLVKSTTGATAATFKVLAYQAAPTLTSVFDTTVYNPKLADITSGAFVGYWTCSTQQVNGDNSTYECFSTSSDGHQAFQLTDGTLRFVLETTGAYAPGSGETFNVIADLVTSVP